MATKKEIKETLKELDFTEDEMDSFWNELYETNAIVRNLTDHSKTWRDLNTHAIKDLPTRKEKDLAVAEEKRIKEEQMEKERLQKEADKKYYIEHFDEIMCSKIDNKEDLTEKELRELVFGYAVETDYGDNRRWSRNANTIVKLCGRAFAINWEEGLTENQENEFYNQPYEVEQRTYEKTIMVTEWVAV